MTGEEREQLVRFLQLLVQAQAGPRDPEADGLIRDACARQPDAAYLLVQRTLQLEMAQQASLARVAQLEGELESARRGPPTGSFLGNANAWGRQSSAVAASVSASGQPLAAGRPPHTVQPLAAAPASSWGSGLLGTVASTAVGVVAGGMLMHGIGSMMGSRQEKDHATVPPGGGTLVESSYANAGLGEDSDGGYIAEDFDSGNVSDPGDVT